MRKGRYAEVMRQFENYLKANRLSDNLKYAYTLSISRMLNHLQVDPRSLTIQDIKNYVTYLEDEYISSYTKRKLTKKSLSNYFGAINKFIEFIAKELQNRNMLEEDIETGYRKLYSVELYESDTKPKKALSKDEIKLIFDTVSHKIPSVEEWRRQRNIALVKTLYYAVPRARELLDMNVDDINLKEGTLNIHDKKTKKWDTIAVDEDCINALSEWLKSRKTLHPDDNALWLNEFGRRMAYKSLQLVLQYIEVRAKLPTHLYPHLFRHTGITHLAEDGCNVFQIQSVSRHKSVETLKIYVDKARMQEQKIGHRLSKGLVPEDETPKQPIPPKQTPPQADVSVAQMPDYQEYLEFLKWKKSQDVSYQ
jgi:site-specific recombinase XerD